MTANARRPTPESNPWCLEAPYEASKPPWFEHGRRNVAFMGVGRVALRFFEPLNRSSPTLLWHMGRAKGRQPAAARSRKAAAQPQ